MKRLFQLTNLDILHSVQLPVERARQSFVDPATGMFAHTDVYTITVTADNAEEIDALVECGFGKYLV